MKTFVSVLVACTALATGAMAADPAGPADKTDAGSLSSGAKEASPSTKGKGENAPVGNDATSGSSSGDNGSETVPGTKKGMGGSDPRGVEKK